MIDEMMNVLYMIMNMSYNEWSSYCVVDIAGFQRQLNEELVGLTIHYGKRNIMKIEVKWLDNDVPCWIIIVKVGLELWKLG
jgi:hypothetical protein